MEEIEKKDELNKSLTKKESEYNLIEFPSEPLKDVDKKITLIDEVTRNALVEYLKIDSYRLVENLAKVTNSDNAANIIAYRDGALGRNQALIEKFNGMVQKNEFVDRIKGKVRQIGGDDKEEK